MVIGCADWSWVAWSLRLLAAGSVVVLLWLVMPVNALKSQTPVKQMTTKKMRTPIFSLRDMSSMHLW